MRLLLSIILTCAALLGHSAAFAEGPQCARIWLGKPDINMSVQQKLTDLQKTLLKLRQDIKAAADKNDPLAPLITLEHDPRELAYLLQGSYRLIIAHPMAKELLTEKDFKRVKKGLDELKWLEKTLGRYTTQIELLETAQKHEMAPDFIRHLQSRREQVSQEVYAELKKADYLDKEISAITELTEKISKFKIPENFDQRNWLKASLESELARIHEKVQTEMAPLIKTNSYGYHELEFGAHALRRSLRWIKVYLNAYPDHFILVKDKSALSEKDTEMMTKYNGKFSLSYSGDGVLQIRDTDYARIIKYVDSLRKIKKAGEMQELLSQELTLFGRWNGQFIGRERAIQVISEPIKKEDGKLEKKTQEILIEFESRNGFEDILMEGAL